MSANAGPPEAESPAQEEASPKGPIMAEYRLWLHTSSHKGAGSKGSVSIELHGQEGSSGMQPVKPSREGAFDRGQVRIEPTTTCCATV